MSKSKVGYAAYYSSVGIVSNAHRSRASLVEAHGRTSAYKIVRVDLDKALVEVRELPRRRAGKGKV